MQTRANQLRIRRHDFDHEFLGADMIVDRQAVLAVCRKCVGYTRTENENDDCEFCFHASGICRRASS